MDAKNGVQRETKRDFADVLKELMKNPEINNRGRRVSQENLAIALSKKLGIPVKRQTIGLYIKKKSSPDLEKFKAIADYFNVSYDYMLGESGSQKRDHIDISEKTGLNDSAIEYLSFIKKEAELPPAENCENNIEYIKMNKSILQLINSLLSSEDIYNVATYIARYAELSKEYKRQIEILRENYKSKAKDEREGLELSFEYNEFLEYIGNKSVEGTTEKRIEDINREIKYVEWQTVNLIKDILLQNVELLDGYTEIQKL